MCRCIRFNSGAVALGVRPLVAIVFVGHSGSKELPEAASGLFILGATMNRRQFIIGFSLAPILATNSATPNLGFVKLAVLPARVRAIPIYNGDLVRHILARAGNPRVHSISINGLYATNESAVKDGDMVIVCTRVFATGPRLKVT